MTLILFAALIVGCDEEQLERADRIVSDMNNVVAGGRAAVGSPAGQLVPKEARLLIELALGLASAGVIAYQKWRGLIVKKTLTAVVSGIEQAEEKAQINPTNPVKTSIEMAMKNAKVYDQANKIVDKIKIGL